MKLIFTLCILFLNLHTSLGLYISLVEERPHSRAWHFGLLLHDGPRIKGRPKAMIDQALIQNRTPGSNQRLMKYDPTIQSVRQNQLVVTVGPLRMQGAPNNDALEANILSIFQQIPPSEITAKAQFKNCLDFTLEAVKRLRDGGYMTSKQYEKFWDYHRRMGPEVRRKTDANILRICGKGQNCKQAPAAVKKAPAANKPPAGKAGPGKVKRSIRYD